MAIPVSSLTVRTVDLTQGNPEIDSQVVEQFDDAGVAGKENITKPDGTPVADLAGVAGGLIGTGASFAANALLQTPVGQAFGKGVAIANQAVETVSRITDTARRVTGAVQEGATVLANAANKLRENPLELGGDLLKGIGDVPDSLGSFLSGFAGASASGPPYPNVLDGFADYNCLWTLSCLEPEQFNNPVSYRDKPSALKHIVFSSAGRFDPARTPTKFGAPEFFIDNINFRSVISATPASGNTNVIGFSFEIYEPYSMGLFLQSLQVASINAGYPNYLSGTPYLLMLQFVGNTDSGSVLPVNDALTKYFTVMITKCDMTVDQGGSRYTVTASPYHHIGFGDSVQNTKSEVRLIGSTVKEVLSTGENSLVEHLNKTEQELVAAGKQTLADEYEIVFPIDASSNSSQLIGDINVGSATINPTKIVSSIIKGTSGVGKSIDVGSNKISASPMPFKDSTSGNFVYKNENEVINADIGGIVDVNKMSIDQSSREFRFPQNSKIIQIIQDTILVSKYATDAIKEENLDGSGMAQWFKIDLHIEMLGIDVIRGIRAKKYIFRVLPFLVSGEILKNPSAATAGTNNLKKIIAKRYDYLYTGQNNHIIKFDLTFNAMFYTGAHARATGTTHTRDKDRNAATDAPDTTTVAQAGGTSAIASTAGSAPVKYDASDKRLFKSSPVGDKTVEQEVADWFQKQFEDSSSDLINVEMDIIGDPYFLSDSGVNANYNAPPGPSSQIRSDGAMNYEGSEIFVFVAFRTPIEPNLAVSGQGGLYNFPAGGVSPFSGIYKLNFVDNKWSGGTYTQTLKMIRVLGQDGDLIGKENIVLENQSLYSDPIQVPSKQTPAADAEIEVDSTYIEEPEKTEEVLQNADNLKQQTPGRGAAPSGTPTRSYQEYQQNFGPQNAQSVGQSTYLGTGSSLPVANANSAPINYNDPQFQSQAQLDAEVAREEALLAAEEARRRR